MTALRPSQSRTRPRKPPLKIIDLFEESDQDELSITHEDEPPLKRIRVSRKAQKTTSRWIPGGRGGGGRHVEADELGSPTVTPRKNADAPKPRARERRDRNSRNVTTTRHSARSRNRGAARPRYSTAAAATAAAAHGDGYKPREERGWEEFHADLDLDADFAVIPSEEVDGVVKNPGLVQPIGEQKPLEGIENRDLVTLVALTPTRRRPGRPPRSRDSMLQALLIPEAPKFVPAPGPNPRERLTLPKPSFRELDPFLSYEQKDVAQVNFVDKSMANIGYQESEVFLRPERVLIRQMEGSAEEDLDLSPDLITNSENSAIGSNGVGRVEYDMDEQDVRWLDAFNKTRTQDSIAMIKPAIFEITMTKIEKEWHALEKRIPKPNPKAPQTQRPRSSSAAAVNGEPLTNEEPDSKCAVCDDGDCENSNAIVFCDGCDLAVHQECYGVPYIPEGQWLCRKCQLVGNARPSCIFCPNEGGAFKQTNNSKWAHLFCATWIPEVTIGNVSLMEPITDVEKVPASRWKLKCYICRQEMGASIQCSDGRCYEAFHLTCARQAGLYLRMKTGGGQNTLMDASQLRAYCHRHTPGDWRLQHNTDRSFEHAVKFFREHFRGQVWADSRASALAITDSQSHQHADGGNVRMTLTNKRSQKPKTIWRLPSGAPVIPEVILKSIEDSLVRFSVQRKKEFVAEICKYWTLKREARRGAALLKRLQLQMDTFSSFEVTRRDYKAQGAAGRARLDRRIEFAEILAKDLERIKSVCRMIKEREEEKLKDALLLKDVIDTVYLPVTPLIEPIIDKALRHDRGLYRVGLMKVRELVGKRYYTSVPSFCSDVVQVFALALGMNVSGIEDLLNQVSGRADDMTGDQRERRSHARRIIKAIQPSLDEALAKESELIGRPYAQQMKELDAALLSRHDSLAESIEVATNKLNDVQDHSDQASPQTPLEHSDDAHISVVNTTASHPERVVNGQSSDKMSDAYQSNSTAMTNTPPGSIDGARTEAALLDHNPTNSLQPLEPPTPPVSLQGQHQSMLAGGGIPWYVEPFDPDGITIYEERWTGPEVLRDMSEELSEMDEAELEELNADDHFVNVNESRENSSTIQSIAAAVESTPAKAAARPAKKAANKRSRNGDWGRRSFRNRTWK